MRRVVVLGATGSIGTNALRILEALGSSYRVVGLTGHRNVSLLKSQCDRFLPEAVAVTESGVGQDLHDRLSGSVRVCSGPDGIRELLDATAPDIVLSAISGAAGLQPTFQALKVAKRIAIANKEPLVMAGALLMEEARIRGVEMIPVDSEHSAIFQCLDHRDRSEIKRLVLTGSGGPFREWSLERMARATVEDALQHPTWQMGHKITVDSATLMNKGLEVIEATCLFGISCDRVDVMIHPESKIHGLVELKDGSWIWHAGPTDMGIPIQYALTYPERRPCHVKPWDPLANGSLSFSPPDLGRFPCLGLAYEASRAGGTVPAVMNAANEEAVFAFLRREVRLDAIPRVVRQVMESWPVDPVESVESVMAADARARRKARELIQKETG